MLNWTLVPDLYLCQVGVIHLISPWFDNLYLYRFCVDTVVSPMVSYSYSALWRFAVLPLFPKSLNRDITTGRRPRAASHTNRSVQLRVSLLVRQDPCAAAVPYFSNSCRLRQCRQKRIGQYRNRLVAQQDVSAYVRLRGPTAFGRQSAADGCDLGSLLMQN